MACARCQSVPLSPSDRGRLLLTAPVPELMLKTRALLRQRGIPYQRDEAVVVLPDVCLVDFLTLLRESDIFNPMERRDIIALLLRDGEVLGFEAFNRAKSLERWLSLLDARALLEVLEEQRFTAWYQPVLSVRDDRPIGYECLLRGELADGTLLLPADIFPCAASNDLLFQVDRRAREVALRCAAEQHLDGSLFVNFLPSAIYDPQHCLKTTVALAEHLGIPPKRLVFEVVETERITEIEHLKSILDFYRDAGYRVALDDVGSGYASLKLLAMLRPDIIKVDMEITRGIHTDPDRQAVFHALVSIARELGIQVLAEGIETEEEMAYVSTSGADLVQGYLFAQPMPLPPRRHDWIASHHRRS